jgi:hypothetical protein
MTTTDTVFAGSILQLHRHEPGLSPTLAWLLSARPGSTFGKIPETAAGTGSSPKPCIVPC